MLKLILTTLVITVSLLSAAQPRKIIFVCEHGAAKSVIAAAYFNKMAKERNLNYEAVSRGTFPDTTISKGTKEGLTLDGLFDSNVRPTKLMISDTTNAERIVLFTNMPEDFKTTIKAENWSNLEAIDADYPHRKNTIIKSINCLLDTLSKHN
jgi:arsenate reductase